jgi:hypothetical protein
MHIAIPRPGLPGRTLAGLSVIAASVLLAAVGARPYAGGWNDGSRLATVECLVDYRTLVIERSIFVQVPPAHETGGISPYPADDASLREQGTLDKLCIGGRYYSDKSPVPALLMAGLYGALQHFTGLRARDHPGQFCYWMTLGSSGLAYVVAVWCVWRLGRAVGVAGPWGVALAASFGLCTVALPYARHVNNHILLLGAAAALLLVAVRLAEETQGGGLPWGRLTALGALAGLGYGIDLGAGPPLLVCTLALVAYRCRRPGAVAVFVLAAAPWLALHHLVNYHVGGTLRPANAVPGYFEWPGSPFTSTNLTGIWNHRSVGHFLTYAAALLAGKRGLLGHNLPLFLALPGAVVLLRRQVAELPELLFAGCWGGMTWLAYALTSTNTSGQCLSVRWLVPLLAPGYYVLALLVRRYPSHRNDLLILSVWGAVLAGPMWYYGPWIKHLVPMFWPIQAAALLSWASWRARARHRAGAAAESPGQTARSVPDAA